MPESSAARQMLMKKKAAKMAGMARAMHELKADNQKKGKARGAGGKVRPHKQMVAIALNKVRKGY